jgi:hypothetical protein
MFFFSSAQGHCLAQAICRSKVSLGIFLKIDITERIFSELIGMRSNMNNESNTGKFADL